MTDLQAIAPRPRFIALTDEVAEAYGVTRDQILSARRIGLWSEARQMLFLLAQERFGWSTTQIGRMIGRDHSTVVHGIQQARKRIAEGAA